MTNFNFSINRILAVKENLVNRVRLASLSSKFGPTLATLICLCILTIGVGNAWGASYTATYTVNSTSSVTQSGNAPTGSSATFSQDYTTAGQMTQAKPNSLLTLTGYDGKKITGVTLNVKRTNSKTANVTIKVGSTTIGSNAALAPGNSYGDKTISITSTTVGADEDVTIKMVASGSSVFISSYKITWEDATPHDVSFSTGTGNPSVATRRGVTITLPDEDDLTPSCSEDGWTLYGWATSAYGSSSTTDAPTSTFVGCGGDTYEPSDDITLYAVYAKVATDVSPTAQTLSFEYSTTTWRKYHFTDKSSYWLIHGDDGYIESPMMMDLSKITSIVVQAGYFGGSNYGKFQLSGRGTNYGSEQSCSNNNESTTKTIEPDTNPLSGRGRIKLLCTGTASDANGVRIKTITINYTAPPTYYYSNPTCAACTANPTVGTAQLKGAFSLSNFCSFFLHLVIISVFQRSIHILLSVCGNTIPRYTLVYIYSMCCGSNGGGGLSRFLTASTARRDVYTLRGGKAAMLLYASASLPDGQRTCLLLSAAPSLRVSVG